MGTKTPWNEEASGCALCFGSGKPLGPVQPRYVQVRITGMRAGGSLGADDSIIPNGRYRLQHVEDCVYRLTTDQLQVTLDWAATRTRVFVRQLGVFDSTFFSDVGVLCAVSIDGNSINFKDLAAADGKAIITWSEDGL